MAAWHGGANLKSDGASGTGARQCCWWHRCSRSEPREASAGQVVGRPPSDIGPVTPTHLDSLEELPPPPPRLRRAQLRLGASRPSPWALAATKIHIQRTPPSWVRGRPSPERTDPPMQRPLERCRRTHTCAIPLSSSLFFPSLATRPTLSLATCLPGVIPK